jgi:alcohol dehydrogenase class IV
MSLFTFPRKIYFQRDQSEDMSEIFVNENIRKALVITDQNIYRSYRKKIEKMFENIDAEIYADVLPEPSVDSIEEAFKRYHKFSPDFIVAIGGGSVIDFAKSMVIKFSYPDKDLREINPFERLSLHVKLMAIPTTSGTGSDATFAVVLTDKDRKLALGNYELVPEIDILDSSLTPLNKNAISVTGIDAFVHSFEAISSNTATILTDALAEKAIETIFQNLNSAMENNEEAKDLMHLSATMAGIAFSNSGTGLAHALGHSFGATFHVVHGTSVGLFLPYVIEFNSQDEKTMKKYLKIAKLENCKNIQELIAKIKEFYKSVGQKCTIKELGIEKGSYYSSIDTMIEKSLEDSELAFNPVVVGEEELKSIYKRAYEG